MNVHKMSSATDSDAEYIKRRIEEADALDNEAQAKSQRSLQLRIEAGQRLAEVRDRTPHGGWGKWMALNGIPASTAHDLMTLAGRTEKEREEKKAKERVRKNTENKKKKKRAEAKTTWGWIAAINAFAKGLGNTQWGGQQKRELESDLGFSLDGKFEEETARKIAAMAEARWAKPEELPENARQKVQRILDRKLAELQRGYHEAVRQQVLKDTAEHLKTLNEMEQKARDAEHQWSELVAGQQGVLTREEFQLIRGCLHPDREATIERKQRAFDIFNRLEGKLVNTRRS